MLEQLFLTAIITCSTGQAVCNSYELEEFTRVEVCGVVPEDQRDQVGHNEPRVFRGVLDGKMHVVSIRPFCEVY